MNPSQFYIEALQKVLSEQILAICSFSIKGFSFLHATALVTLLEGNDISIKLTDRGYELNEQADKTFETIENLLEFVSPLYTQKKHALLLNALEALSSHDS